MDGYNSQVSVKEHKRVEEKVFSPPYQALVLGAGQKNGEQADRLRESICLSNNLTNIHRVIASYLGAVSRRPNILENSNNSRAVSHRNKN